jgi:hypothetical protein
MKFAWFAAISPIPLIAHLIRSWSAKRSVVQLP